MKFIAMSLFLGSLSLPLSATVESSVIPMMEQIYGQDVGKKANSKQKKAMQRAVENRSKNMRVMTYNMLYNAEDAENKLPPKYRWKERKPRLKEYLLYANADLIGSQELQESQVPEVLKMLGPDYGWYGEKTRENEGRSDINAIFFKKSRLELLETATIPYPHSEYNNAFTFCRFQDSSQGKTFVVVNTKLSYGDPERRLHEATQLNEFSNRLPKETPVIIMGDFNSFPFIQDKRNLFFDGDFILEILGSEKLKCAKAKSSYGHFGPVCSITNSNTTLEPFAGPQLPGFILDHIFINDCIEVATHGIDIARVNGEFPSDHFPVIAELYIR